MIEELRRKHAVTDVLPEPPIALPLRFIEELVERRFLREIGMAPMVVADVFGFVAHERGLHVDEPGPRGIGIVGVAVDHACQRRVGLRWTRALHFEREAVVGFAVVVGEFLRRPFAAAQRIEVAEVGAHTGGQRRAASAWRSIRSGPVEFERAEKDDLRAEIEPGLPNEIRKPWNE